MPKLFPHSHIGTVRHHHKDNSHRHHKLAYTIRGTPISEMCVFVNPETYAEVLSRRSRGDSLHVTGSNGIGAPSCCFFRKSDDFQHPLVRTPATRQVATTAQAARPSAQSSRQSPVARHTHSTVDLAGASAFAAHIRI